MKIHKYNNFQSNWILSKSSFYMNTHSDAFTPLCCIALFMMRCSKPYLPYLRPISISSRYEFVWSRHVTEFFNANFIVHWVQIWALEPQAWQNKLGCFPFQKFNMVDEGCAHSLSWHIVLLEDKELTTDLAQDRQLLLSQKYAMVIHVR